jgi:hypothetical protein
MHEVLFHSVKNVLKIAIPESFCNKGSVMDAQFHVRLKLESFTNGLYCTYGK